MRHHESRLQSQCVRWFRLQYPHLATLLFAIPNGGYRSKTEAAIMKGEGVTAGVADLMLATRNRILPEPLKHRQTYTVYNGLFIEMKTERGRQSPAQKLWGQSVEAEGYRYIIVRSLEDFIQQITNYLSH